MDFGCGDIAAGIKLCVTLYQYGLSADNAADVRYKLFRNDVHNFGSLLRTLDDSIRRAHLRFRTDLVLDRTPLDVLAVDFEDERKAIIGNFNATLEECRTFLEHRRRYATHRSNPGQNLAWHLTQDEQRVDDLRQRIGFHMYKIRFVIDRLSLKILSDVDANVDDTRALVEENLDVSHEILEEVSNFRSDLFGYLGGQRQLPQQYDMHFASPAIATRFQHCIDSGGPRMSGSNPPLKEGFDALLHALEQSNKGSDQTPETYLAFLKARWLVGKIKSGAEYEHARPGFYFKRATRQVERSLKTRVRSRGGLIQYEEADLLSLPSTCFKIWESSATPVSDDIDMQVDVPRGDEVQIAIMDLATDQPGRTDTLTILKRSETQFRAVRKLTSSSSSQQVLREIQIDVREDSLVPRYLLPTLANPCLEMSVLSRGTDHSFRFQNLEDLYSLQSALTGFQISHDQQSITCQFSNSTRDLDCKARIQLWQEPLEARFSGQDASPTNSGSAAGRSGSRPGTQVSIAATNTVVQTSDGFEAQSIKRCAITLFFERGHSDGQHSLAIAFIELPDDSHIDENLCSCRRDYDTCSKLVLVRDKKRPLPVRFRDCDLNSFDVLEYRLSSAFGRSSRAQTDHLLLKFASLEEKKRFHAEMKLRFRVRNAQIDDQRNFGANFRQRQDQPQRLPQAQSQTARRASNVAGPSRASIRMPQLPPIDSGPTFAGGIGTRSSRNLNRPPPELSLRTRGTPPVSSRTMSPATAGTDSDSAIDMGDPEEPEWLIGAVQLQPGSGVRESYAHSPANINEDYGLDPSRRVNGTTPRQASRSVIPAATPASGDNATSRWRRTFSRTRLPHG